MKLGRNRYRKIEYITIPYSNDSENIKCGWFVSSSTDVPTTNAKSLTPLLEGGGELAKGERNRGERRIGEAR